MRNLLCDKDSSSYEGYYPENKNIKKFFLHGVYILISEGRERNKNKIHQKVLKAKEKSKTQMLVVNYQRGGTSTLALCSKHVSMFKLRAVQLDKMKQGSYQVAMGHIATGNPITESLVGHCDH
jgi:hypothetical protein